MKESFSEKGFIGRLGGDEYLAIIENIEIEEELMEFAECIIQSFSEIQIIESDPIHLSASIGVAIYPRDGEDRSTLLRKADIAMYNVKKTGKNGYKLFEGDFEESYEVEMDMKVGIISALKNREFEVHYQPVVSLADGNIESVEALIRWKKSNEAISPEEFIPIAEKYGLINQIDYYMLEQVCEEIKSCKIPLVDFPRVSLNLSPRTMMDPNLMKNIQGIIKNSDIPPPYFIFEVTETAVIYNVKDSFDKIISLRKYGCDVCLDDFGTGFSSLNHLRTLPVTSIKIDKIFIDGIGLNKKEEIVIKAILSLANSLDIDIIPEGVETKEQIEFLRNYGCKKIQGYLYFKPMRIQDLQNILTSNLINQVN